MNMNVIPQSDDLDDHLQDDIIINTVFDNDVDIDDLHSQSEWDMPDQQNVSCNQIICQHTLSDLEPNPTPLQVSINLSEQLLRPICERIVHTEDHNKDISYDAE